MKDSNNLLFNTRTHFLVGSYSSEGNTVRGFYTLLVGHASRLTHP